VKASLSVALALAGACLAVRAEAQTVVVGPSTSSMALVPGAQVTVPIVADLSGSGGASLGSITARLLWHPSVLAYRGVSAGTLGAAVVNADSAAGSLRFALANPAGATGQPVLVNAIFSVVGAAGATDTLRVNLQELTRAGTFADLLPIGTATTSLLCVSTGVFGDLDGSGTVTSADALAIVTSAVGLPITPRTTVNGDVDGSGGVDTRDALIVLSYVVGLPVAGFRVARLNGGACAVQVPASVQIQPGGVAVVIGDRFPLSAAVRDSGGAVVAGIGLVWTSADTAVVKADATGNLVGVGAGTAKVFANAAPGLKDSVTVTVSGTRHVWFVNPALAALNGGVELGSNTYPFSTIAQAVIRAGAFDSVFVAPAVYGEGVHLTRTIFVFGDSTAAGRTIIRNPTGPAVLVDSLSTGGVRLDRLWLEDSFGGVLVEGTGTGVIDLRRINVTRSRTVGIAARRVAQVMLDNVAVQGAILRGIEVDSVPVVGLKAVLVDLVGRDASSSGRDVHAVHVATADSVTVDSLLLGSAGFRLDSARVASFSHFMARGIDGPALFAIVGQKFVLDSADISGVGPAGSPPGDTMPAAVGILLGGGSATARVSHATLHGNGRSAIALEGADSVLMSHVSVLDGPGSGGWTVAFKMTRRLAIEYSSFAGTGGTHVGFDGPDSTARITVDSSAFQGTALRVANSGYLGVRRTVFANVAGSAVQANLVRTVSLVGVDVSNTAASPDYSVYGGPFALDVIAADSLRVDSSAFHDNQFGALICRSCRAVFAARSGFVRNLLDPSYASSEGGNIVLENAGRSTLYGLTVTGASRTGVWLRLWGTGSRTVIDSSAVNGAPVLVKTDQSYNYGSGDTLVISRSVLRTDGTGVWASALSSLTLSGSTVDSAQFGVRWSSPGRVHVSGSTFSRIGYIAIDIQSGTVAIDSNAIDGIAGGYGIALQGASGSVTRNTITGATNGVYAYTAFNPQRLRIAGNTIERDTLYSGVSITVGYNYDSVTIVGNTIRRGLGSGIEMSADWGGIGYARVDSNVVQGLRGTGMYFFGTIAQLSLTYNTIADNRGDGVNVGAFGPLQAAYNTVVRNGRHGVYIPSAAAAVFRRSNIFGNAGYGVTKNQGPAVLADSSYWGRTVGPRCGVGCDSVVAGGDSVNVLVTFLPYDTALVAGVAGAPPVPAVLAPAPAFRGAPPVGAVPEPPLVRAVERPTLLNRPQPEGRRP
jgi:hypothetical protein